MKKYIYVTFTVSFFVFLNVTGFVRFEECCFLLIIDLSGGTTLLGSNTWICFSLSVAKFELSRHITLKFQKKNHFQKRFYIFSDLRRNHTHLVRILKSLWARSLYSSSSLYFFSRKSLISSSVDSNLDWRSLVKRLLRLPMAGWEMVDGIFFIGGSSSLSQSNILNTGEYVSLFLSDATSSLLVWKYTHRYNMSISQRIQDIIKFAWIFFDLLL